MNNDGNITLVDQEVEEGRSILSNCINDLDDIYEHVNVITSELEKTKGFDLISKNNINLDYNPPIAIRDCSFTITNKTACICCVGRGKCYCTC